MVHALPPIRRKGKPHRTTALAKLKDKYDYTDITFPISYDQVSKFEDANEVTINIWRVAEDTKPIYIVPVMSCTVGAAW